MLNSKDRSMKVNSKESSFTALHGDVVASLKLRTEKSSINIWKQNQIAQCHNHKQPNLLTRKPFSITDLTFKKAHGSYGKQKHGYHQEGFNSPNFSSQHQIQQEPNSLLIKLHNYQYIEVSKEQNQDR